MTTEAPFQASVIELAHHLHLTVAHFRRARVGRKWMTPVGADGAGFPDLVIVGPGGILYREMKTDAKYPSPAQRAWGAKLTEAGGDWGVWKPKDLLSGLIHAELKGVA